ncbi:MAG TPA: acylphosphatase [Erysipelothrix sp.]
MIFRRLSKLFQSNVVNQIKDDFEPSEQVCKHVFFSGIVQNVGFRFEVYRQAQVLGIVGWVRNLEDGRVEARLQGERLRVEALINHLYTIKRFQIDDLQMEDCRYDLKL